MLKKIFLFFIIFCFFPALTKAQLCWWGKGQISVINEKGNPINRFQIRFYKTDTLDLSKKTKVIRAEYMKNAWDIYLNKVEAEEFIKTTSPFPYDGRFKRTNEKSEKVVFYKGNTYNYRTLSHFENPILTKITAKGYENFYFISPVFGGCSYYNSIKLKKVEQHQHIFQSTNDSKKIRPFTRSTSLHSAV